MNEVPKDQAVAAQKKRKRQKPDMCGVCHESQLLVYMLCWSMVSSDVTGPPWFTPSRGSERLQSSAVSCAGLFFFAVRNALDAALGGTTTFRQHEFEASTSQRKHVPASFVSTALHVLTRHVFNNIVVDFMPLLLVPKMLCRVNAQLLEVCSSESSKKR